MLNIDVGLVAAAPVRSSHRCGPGHRESYVTTGQIQYHERRARGRASVRHAGAKGTVRLSLGVNNFKKCLLRAMERRICPALDSQYSVSNAAVRVSKCSRLCPSAPWAAPQEPTPLLDILGLGSKKGSGIYCILYLDLCVKNRRARSLKIKPDPRCARQWRTLSPQNRLVAS